MICEHCGCFFCGDDAGLDGPRTRFCSKNCGKYASRKRTGRKAREQRSIRDRARIENRCSRKVRYGTAGQASRALRQMRERKGANSAFGGIYQCGDCDGWHITSRATPIPIRPQSWPTLNGTGK